MKFIIRRTSRQEPPCEAVVLEEFVVTEWRTVSEEEFDKRFGSKEGLWRSKGVNHRTNKDGWIGRDHLDKKRTEYVVEINSLQELINFVEEYGEIIINYRHEDIPSIEIYDDYRE